MAGLSELLGQTDATRASDEKSVRADTSKARNASHGSSVELDLSSSARALGSDKHRG